MVAQCSCKVGSEWCRRAESCGSRSGASAGRLTNRGKCAEREIHCFRNWLDRPPNYIAVCIACLSQLPIHHLINASSINYQARVFYKPVEGKATLIVTPIEI